MLSSIFTQAPIWVWPLFIGLLFLGLRSTKARSVPLIIAYATPLLALISIQSVARMPDQALVWPLYVLFYGVGATIGFMVQKRWVIAKQPTRVSLAGEWLSLVTFMFIFWLNFASGILRSIAPEVMTSVTAQVALTILIACIGGVFGGRALRIWRS